jgi:two-component system, OmpR family, sensor histidine kinase MtrB
MRRPGLRTRVTAIFAGGALVLSATMAMLSYGFTRGSLVAERERTATRTTYFDASVAQSGLASPNADVLAVLRALDTGSVRRPVVYRNGEPYSRTADVGTTPEIPLALRRLVESGSPGVQRLHSGNGTIMIFGIPLSPTTQFYEIHSMQELDQTLQVIALVLALVAAGTTVAGAALGWYTTRRVLRPLASVTQAAQGIAGGDLTARLDDAAEPELEPLTSSFNHMVGQLAKRIERDRRFAADVSHELRSPLQTLSAAATVLLNRRGNLDARTATAAELVADEVTRFQHLVTDLLEIARGDLPPEWSTVDIVDFARRVSRARGLDADVVQVLPGTERAWRVDVRRLEQLLANLLDNAARHGGGVVAVRLGSDHSAGFIEVDDEGPGVLPEARETIFNPFVRGQTANARADGGGAGLGLALVAQHAATHGGRVTVLDRPGGGARFRVDLPESRP